RATKSRRRCGTDWTGHALLGLRLRQPRAGEVLPGMRRAPRVALRRLWDAIDADREVLWRVRSRGYHRPSRRAVVNDTVQLAERLHAPVPRGQDAHIANSSRG